MPIEPEQFDKQIDKWRKQQKINKAVIGVALVLLVIVVGTSVTFFLIDRLRPIPTLTPTTLIDELRTWDGRIVKLKGRVQIIDNWTIRLSDDKSYSIMCKFKHQLGGLKEGEEITVKGEVSMSSLVECEMAN